MFARYEEALSDFKVLEKLRLETKTMVTVEERRLKNDIDKAIRGVGGRDQQQKDELVRAVDVRCFSIHFMRCTF